MAQGTKEPVVRSPEYGGDGGGSFDDFNSFAENYARITQIEVRADYTIDAVHLTYSDGKVLKRGGDLGNLHTLQLEDDENITAVSGRSGRQLHQITFHTNKGRTLGPLGGNDGAPFNIDFGEGHQLLYLFGRYGLQIDALGFGYGPNPPPEPGTTYKGDAYGVDGGKGFDTHTPGAKITGVHIRYGLRIDAIQVQYNGQWSERQGKAGGAPIIVYIPGDHLSKITGTYDSSSLRSIQLHTHRGWTSREYGDRSGTPFTIHKEGCVISGIHGKYGDLLEKIGGYYEVFSR